MAEESFPFDGGELVNEAQWAKMAVMFAPTGVKAITLPGPPYLDPNGPLSVHASSPASLTVQVTAGDAFVEGFFYTTDAIISKTLSAANASNPRDDLIVLRRDRTAKKVSIEILTGAPSAVPVTPTPTVSTSLFELPLARIRVNAAAGTIVEANIFDLRVSSSDPRNPPISGLSFPVGAQRAGTRFFRTDTSQDWIHDGADWCMAPGQVVATKPFGDTQVLPYNVGSAAYGGQVRVGSRAGTDSLFSWSTPRILAARGFEMNVISAVASINSVLHDSVSLVVRWDGANNQEILSIRGVIHGQYSSVYNSNLVGYAYLDGYHFAAQQGINTWDVSGQCPTGLVQFYWGMLTIKTA